MVTRRPLEGGPRIFEQNVNTWYVGGGFRGDFTAAERDFYWDVNAVWSRNQRRPDTHGSYNALQDPERARARNRPWMSMAQPRRPAARSLTWPACHRSQSDPELRAVQYLRRPGRRAGTITQDMLGYIQPDAA